MSNYLYRKGIISTITGKNLPVYHLTIPGKKSCNHYTENYLIQQVTWY